LESVSETLSDFIARRRRELDAAEAALNEQLRAITVERAKLQQAELAASKPGVTGAELEPSWRRRKSGIKPNTIMDDIIKLLGKHRDGLIALDILRLLNENRDKKIRRTSLSPQLSRLKQSGYIELQGSTWRLSTPPELKEDDDDAN
jgi:hypothetical protein